MSYIELTLTMVIQPEKDTPYYIYVHKKKRIVIPTTQSFLLNLKSNTMKNTVQKYCIFLI